LNPQIGWAVGYNGSILRTTNGGQNWIIQQTSVSLIYREIKFIDENYGWIVGYGTILRTSDGGISWHSNNYVTNNSLFSIHVLDSLTAWTVGSQGTILHTKNGGELVVSKKLISKVPVTIYPNPTNGILQIKTENKIEDIQLFDVAGRFIPVTLKADNTLELNKIIAGLYWVHIKTVDGIAIQKVVKQ
jgi:hypothetical protein